MYIYVRRNVLHFIVNFNYVQVSLLKLNAVKCNTVLFESKQYGKLQCIPLR